MKTITYSKATNLIDRMLLIKTNVTEWSRTLIYKRGNTFVTMSYSYNGSFSEASYTEI